MKLMLIYSLNIPYLAQQSKQLDLQRNDTRTDLLFYNGVMNIVRDRIGGCLSIAKI